MNAELYRLKTAGEAGWDGIRLYSVKPQLKFMGGVREIRSISETAVEIVHSIAGDSYVRLEAIVQPFRFEAIKEA